ncbi:hypothetical protein PRZ48_006502 [Zasmidium cellare]|uniref:Uncharacterized protein n=1 Tax=Zasmidium cellare TaxID=395010 RepID=A0ABR0ENL5_ZASCE|nr:hypothetical protein PRZ48_006502 [Zasmidium cellare]
MLTPTTTLTSLLSLVLLATTTLALPTTDNPIPIFKRSNSATTHGASAPGDTHCDVSFGDAYYVHVGEPWNGGAGCDNLYNSLSDRGWGGITGWSCQPDGGPDANGWQPTYLGFNAPAGNQPQISDALAAAFRNPDGSGPGFWCAY